MCRHPQTLVPALVHLQGRDRDESRSGTQKRAPRQSSYEIVSLNSVRFGKHRSCIVLAALASASFLWLSQMRGYTLYYGDAASHINIARRIVDSRTPGYKQIGTVWLPLPHVLMAILVRDDSLWRSRLGGARSGAALFVAGVACPLAF